MLNRLQSGSFRLFTLFGIHVFVHWSWLVVAYIQYTIASRGGMFDNHLWHVAVYLGVFAIVLLHEFGHALACRSVGGKAETIVLWPLGGIAYIQPPARPGAVLWAIAAGPLVNVALLPVLWGLVWMVTGEVVEPLRIVHGGSDFHTFLHAIAVLNTVLLAFNILPIYPLDGGQILQATLWFFLGRGQSMTIAASIGLIAAGAGGVAAVAYGDIFLVLIAAFVGWQAFHGWRLGTLLKLAEARGYATDERHPTGQGPPPAQRIGQPNFNPFGPTRSTHEPPEVVATQNPRPAERGWKM